MPEGPWHFPEDQVSDATDRMLAAEITREQLYLQLHAELPYASAVETEKYSERDDGSVEIHQQILVARSSQRAIILGKGGSRLKEIGSRARTELAELMGRKVHRSEAHTSELQSLMRISYAVFCLITKNIKKQK